MNDPLALIYNEGYWRVSEVSPMFNLQYSEIKLKQYASKILQAVVSRVGGSSDSQFSVLIDNIPNLKYSHEDPNGLKITVKNRAKSNEKEVYVAIFLTWGDGLYIDNKTHLPYMLERGDNNVGIAVKYTLQTVFDCIIMPFDFTQQQLVNFMINFIENDTSRSSDLFVLSYQTPEVDKHKTSFKFELGDIRRIWSSIKNDETDQDKKLYTYEILRNEIRQRYTLDVALLRLCEVVLPKAEVKCSGAVKMKTPEVVNAVFTVLNEITREIHVGLDIQKHEEEED